MTRVLIYSALCLGLCAGLMPSAATATSARAEVRAACLYDASASVRESAAYRNADARRRQQMLRAHSPKVAAARRACVAG